MKIIARNAAFCTTFTINYATKLLFDHAAATTIDRSFSRPIFPRSRTTHHTASASAMTTKKSSLGGYIPAWQFLMHTRATVISLTTPAINTSTGNEQSPLFPSFRLPYKSHHRRNYVYAEKYSSKKSLLSLYRFV